MHNLCTTDAKLNNPLYLCYCKTDTAKFYQQSNRNTMTPQQENRYWKLQHQIDDLQTAIDLLSAYRQYGRGITTPDYYSQMKLLVNSKAITERKQLDLFHPQTAEFNHATNTK